MLASNSTFFSLSLSLSLTHSLTSLFLILLVLLLFSSLPEILSSPQPSNIVSPYFNTSQTSQQQPHPSSQPTSQQVPPAPPPPPPPPPPPTPTKQLQSQSKQASSPSQAGQPSLSFIDSISSLTTNPSSILASSGLLAAVQDPKDLLLSEILDQVWSMQQEMNIESNQPTTTAASAQSTTDDSMLLDMLDEVLDPPAPNVTIPLTSIKSPMVSPAPDSQGSPDLKEKLAISAIQRQLMSFETHTPQSSHHTSNQNRPPVYTQPNYLNNSSFQPSLGPTGLTDGLNVTDKKVSEHDIFFALTFFFLSPKC